MEPKRFHLVNCQNWDRQNWKVASDKLLFFLSRVPIRRTDQRLSPPQFEDRGLVILCQKTAVLSVASLASNCLTPMKLVFTCLPSGKSTFLWGKRMFAPRLCVKIYSAYSNSGFGYITYLFFYSQVSLRRAPKQRSCLITSL